MFKARTFLPPPSGFPPTRGTSRRPRPQRVSEGQSSDRDNVALVRWWGCGGALAGVLVRWRGEPRYNIARKGGIGRPSGSQPKASSVEREMDPRGADIDCCARPAIWKF